MSNNRRISVFFRCSLHPKRVFEALGIVGALLLSSSLAACGSSPGGLAADTTAPTISSSTPASGSTVGADATLSITFSEAMDTSTVVIAATDGTNAYNLGTLTWSVDKTVATFSSPPAPLTNGLAYSIAVDGKDVAGNTMTQAVIAITVEDTPKVMVVSPASGVGNVSATNNISLEFNVSADRTSVESALSVKKKSDSSPVTCLFSWSADSKIVSCSHSAALDFNTTYTVDLAASANSAHSGPISANSLVPSDFTIAEAADTTPPTVIRDDSNDAGGAGTGNVLTNSPLVFIFSEQVKTTATLSLTINDVPVTPPAAQWSAGNSRMTFNFPDFPNGATGKWTIAAEDTSGNAMPSPATGTFKVVKQGTVNLQAVSTRSGYTRGLAGHDVTVHTNLSPHHVGDSNGNEIMKIYYSFNYDSSTFPTTMVRVSSATLNATMQTRGGDPSGLGYLRARSVNYGDDLTPEDDTVATDTYCSNFMCFDFSFPFSKPMIQSTRTGATPFVIICPYKCPYQHRFSSSWASGQTHLSVTSSVSYQWTDRATRGERFQFRVSRDTETDDDHVADYESLYGTAEPNATYRPSLDVAYEFTW